MAVDWTPHRFSAGVLALDVANTVVHRGLPEKRFDRFDDPREIVRFAQAALAFRSDELGGCSLAVDDPASVAPVVLALREATDRLFRDAAMSGALRADLLAPFLRAAADGLDGAVFPAASKEPFEAALARSALSLLEPAAWRRIRICANCAWLFADRSRNGSRIWCDMAVCGNRQKAKRHRRRKKEETDHV